MVKSKLAKNNKYLTMGFITLLVAYLDFLSDGRATIKVGRKN